MGYIPTRMIACNSMTAFRRHIKIVIKCILVSSPSKLTVEQLNEDFVDLEGRGIPHLALFRCGSLKDFLKSLWDIVWLEPDTDIVHLVDMPGVNKSYHIRKWVEKEACINNSRVRFIDQTSPTKRLPHWNIMDIINQYPVVEFEDQMNIVVLVNRNKCMMSIQDFEAGVLKVLNIRSIKRSFGCLEKLLEKLSHILHVYGNQIYMDLSIYSIDVKDLGLNPYYVPKVPIIPNIVIENVLRLIAKESHGIWAHHLPELYQEVYGYPLDYWTFGFPSVAQCLGTLPHIFRLRRYKGYFRLYDMRNHDPPAPAVPERYRKKTLSMLARFIEGVNIHYFEAIYYLLYREEFSIEPMRFESILDAVKTLKEDGIIIHTDEEKIMVNLKTRTMARAIRRVVPFLNTKVEDAMPIEWYPDSVLRPGDIVARNRCVESEIEAEGGFEVEIQSIYSPAGFFCTIKNGPWKLLQQQLNDFYNSSAGSMKMPYIAAVPGLFCVARYGKNYERILILGESMTIEHYDVLSIDTGRQEMVWRTSLYYLDNSFKYIPNQAFLCYIAQMEPPQFSLKPRGFKRESIDMFCKLVNNKTLLAKLHTLNMRNMEAGIFLIDTTIDGAHVDVRKTMLQGYYGLVTYKKPLWCPKLYAAWSLYTRLVF